MDLAKKLAKIFSVIFLTLFAASCDKGCVESYEFDQEVVKVDSFPFADGIEGTGSQQVAKWHDTGLKSNGEGIVLQITGGWTPWYSDDYSSEIKLEALQACSFCAKNELSQNCICYSGQVPTSEDGYAGGDCSTNLDAQNDPSKCTCTTQFGSATDYGVYHFPLNKFDKNHNDLGPDNQSVCKYKAGMGLYLGLFGSNGSTTPIRAYHLFSQTEVCDLVRDNKGRCLDDSGVDVTKYIFTSANNKIFVKDDNNGNNGIDLNPGGDTYHSRNEEIKMIILDSRYNDNYGSYQVSFLSGAGSDQDKGLLEFLVTLVEDKIMGTPDDDGVRQGGIVQTMFNNIVQDSGFISILQISLSLYIAFYGLATLIGIAEVSKKELMSRALKIGLIIFFTSSTSWYWYDRIVVGFFKDGMDSVITMFMSFSDRNIDPTSGIITAQMDRAASNTNATRFSYADMIIKNMLSVPSAKKIFGLFFGVPIFGIIYIVGIYALIAFFIYVMLFVAMTYIITITKLAFALALGPIFISFTLSSHTNEMFKKWLAFIGARSLEIIFMFLVLYNFLVLIDQNFTSLLSYKACVTNWNLGLFSIPILKSQVNRSLVEWFSSFIMLGGLIFITKLVLDKVPDLASSLITIGGTASKDSSTAKAAGGMFGGLIGAAQGIGGAAFNVGSTAAAKSFQGIGGAAYSAASGLANSAAQVVRSSVTGSRMMDFAQKALSVLPSNPRAMYRNSIIDSEIRKAQASVKAEGLTGRAADSEVRARVVSALFTGESNKSKSTTIGNSPNKAAFAGLDIDAVGKRLDEKLINKPLIDFIKSETQRMKTSANPLIGRQMRDALDGAINRWAYQNLAGGAESIKSVMSDQNRVVDGLNTGNIGFSNMKEFIRKQTEYTAAEAATAFANNPQKQQEYLQHLKDNEFRLQTQRQKTSDIAFSKTFNKFSNAFYDNVVSPTVKNIKPLDNAFGNDALTDPTRAAKSFMRKVGNEELKSNNTSDYISNFIGKKTGSWLKYKEGSKVNPLKAFGLSRSKTEAINQTIREGERSGLVNYLSKNGFEKEQDAIIKSYNDKLKAAPNHAVKNGIIDKGAEKLNDSKKRKEFFKKELAKVATEFSIKDADKVAKNLEKINRLDSENWKKFRQQQLNKAKNRAKKTLDQASKLLSSEEQRKLAEEKIKAGDEKLKAENLILQKQKEANLQEMVKLKIESNSLSDIVKEIKDLEKKDGTKEIIAKRLSVAKRLSGVDPDAQKQEELAKASYMKSILGEQLKDEYRQALSNHLEKQKDFITDQNTLDAIDRLKTNSAELDNLRKQQEDQTKSVDEKEEIKIKIDLELTKIIAEQEVVRKQAEEALDNLNTANLTQDQLTNLNDLGGLEALKEGLSEINNTTLFEKEARLKYYNEEFNFDRGSGENSTSTQSTDNAAAQGSVDTSSASGREALLSGIAALEAQNKEQADKSAALKIDDINQSKDEKIKNDKDKKDQLITDKKALEEELKDSKEFLEKEFQDAKGKSKDAKNEGDKSGLKSALEVQYSVAQAQLEVLKNKLSLAKTNLSKLESELKAKGGADIEIEIGIRAVKEAINSYENQESVFAERVNSAKSEITKLD
ncbi:MAG: hypothetical protein EBS06_01935 [Proteobacteria bacterium]|nr:hypothetical protein [Pseudomonadota bacterium]